MSFLFKELLVWQDEQPRNGPEQMAIDEALLAAARRPVLRFFSWQGKWVTFGYFQKRGQLSGVDGLECVRRWTGGGTVFHDGQEVTYALVVPKGEPASGLRASEFYRLSHEAMRDALAQVGRPAQLAVDGACRPAEHCFQGVAKFDLAAAEGGKVAGAAQRRSREGLLQQGSVRLEAGLHAPFQQALPECLAEKLERVSALDAPQWIRETGTAASVLVEQKYANPRWQNARA